MGAVRTVAGRCTWCGLACTWQVQLVLDCVPGGGPEYVTDQRCCVAGNPHGICQPRINHARRRRERRI